ncbi:MAG: ATP-binding cassette domain-containing protein [Clostridium sp.]|nr:ATP-binding cassette domain-containing protein [Clostridium sp.]
MLEVRHISKGFHLSERENQVIRDLSFNVDTGEFYVILGQSGCGKSTLLRILGGFDNAGEGGILLDGVPADKPSRDRMMVFQSFDQLFPWFTLRGNLVYAMRKAKIPVPGNDYEGDADSYLKMAGLGDAGDRYPHQLSGGMKQRGALARALCLRPRVLLMDEPFSSLDYTTKKGLYKSITGMKEQTGATVIMVTHDIEEAVILGTTVAVLSKSTGRFSGVYKRGPRGFEAGVREKLESCLEESQEREGAF